ncbi:MAG: nuclear transport factor 2 family protein [Dehalococcoidia bacterium]|nr:MAG: nuclear transport factor 2 family protein [Dehalococcoidia bacterium]TET46952.1 MAG: nuclear transport factor 2 family protein [Dehalococcoidia bacterium]
MATEKSTDEIRRVAMALDNAIENKDPDAVIACFADDCEIELLRHSLVGKAGVKKWFSWLFKNIWQIKFQPVKIMAEGNTLFEEFIIRARLRSGSEVKSKQAEVLIFENDKIKSLRLYFDRLDFADTLTKDPVSKAVLSRIIKKSLEGLTD